MKSTLTTVLEVDKELEQYYRELLSTYKLNKMDETVMEFEGEIKASDGQLSNERIKYYISMFAYYAYALNASLSRHTLRSDVANFYFEHANAQAYVSQKDAEKKLTREDKSALSKLQTENEAKINVLYGRVTQAVETRIRAFNKLIETLNMLGAMNMSEAKLGGRQ
jgi:hypothetical protein